jgi:hypothetical protein
VVTCEPYLDQIPIYYSDVWVSVDMKLDTEKTLGKMDWTP